MATSLNRGLVKAWFVHNKYPLKNKWVLLANQFLAARWVGRTLTSSLNRGLVKAWFVHNKYPLKNKWVLLANQFLAARWVGQTLTLGLKRHQAICIRLKNLRSEKAKIIPLARIGSLDIPAQLISELDSGTKENWKAFVPESIALHFLNPWNIYPSLHRLTQKLCSPSKSTNKRYEHRGSVRDSLYCKNYIPHT